MMGHWWKRIWNDRPDRPRTAAVGRPSRRPAYQPRLELLEDRTLPSATYLPGTTQLAGAAVVSGIVVEDNALYGNGSRGGAGAIAGDGAQNARIQNNILWNNVNPAAIALYRADAAGAATGAVVANN